MDAKDLLSRAWSAVEEAGVPEPLHSVAFKEAIDYLRSEGEGKDEGKGKERAHGLSAGEVAPRRIQGKQRHRMALPTKAVSLPS